MRAALRRPSDSYLLISARPAGTPRVRLIRIAGFNGSDQRCRPSLVMVISEPMDTAVAPDLPVEVHLKTSSGPFDVAGVEITVGPDRRSSTRPDWRSATAQCSSCHAAWPSRRYAPASGPKSEAHQPQPPKTRDEAPRMRVQVTAASVVSKSRSGSGIASLRPATRMFFRHQMRAPGKSSTPPLPALRCRLRCRTRQATGYGWAGGDT